VVYTGLRSDYIRNHASRNEARRIAAMRIIFKRISCTLFTCDMCVCHLRHINDPVLSSLKMEGIFSFVYAYVSPIVLPFINLGFVSPCIIIYSNKLAKQMQQYLSFIACRLNTA
jgi:hypothetical protein